MVVYNKDVEIIKPLDSNQKFDSLKMAVAEEKTFITAVDEQKNQTIYIIFLELTKVKLQKIWESSSIT